MALAHGLRTIGVLGAGQMGLGITYVSALHARVPVLLYDRSTAQIQSGLKLMDKLLAKDVAKGRITAEQASEARERVTVVDQEKAIKGMRDVDMVVEAVSENLSLKQSLFRTLSAELPPTTILASNTSSISITKIAAATIPEGHSAADEQGRKSAARVVEVTTSQDVPGFVSNALLMPFINEAIMCLEKGVATRDDIDKTLKLGMNHPMGPLQLAIQQTLYVGTGDSKYRPSILLERMVDAGWYGKKSGKGFYEYPQ
ncbi:hypothetical protein IEO21_03870 [Rhodonia placenta]|uniref:3-hydroxybutyryl-CoA dehydrogenase n=1 Tax=Rhodonia placenta TaxID=104341 RepID=A0A8H7P568_9APHY|nr:hypothetical protein IEO21_03870 [Postia placenta]